MFPKNINTLGHWVYPKTENNFDLTVTFPNDQSEADKIHKNYKKKHFRSCVQLPVLPCIRAFGFYVRELRD